MSRRHPSSAHFNRTLADYRRGFGQLVDVDDFWLGLNRVHRMNAGGGRVCKYELLVRLQLARVERELLARYESFLIGDEADAFSLQLGALVFGNTPRFSGEKDARHLLPRNASSSCRWTGERAQPAVLNCRPARAALQQRRRRLVDAADGKLRRRERADQRSAYAPRASRRSLGRRARASGGDADSTAPFRAADHRAAAARVASDIFCTRKFYFSLL